MRRLIESTLLALDGVIGEPRVWASDYFDAEAQEKALDQLMEQLSNVVDDIG
jgi:hypothetical protein